MVQGLSSVALDDFFARVFILRNKNDPLNSISTSYAEIAGVKGIEKGEKK